MQILLSIFLLLRIISGQNTEKKPCPKNTPFFLTDKSCSNFSDICFKTDDECKRLLAACDQCPPSNLTISYLSELIKTAKETSNSTKFINEKLQRILENKLEVLKVNIFNGQKNMDKNFEKLLPICITILVVLFMVILIMLVENRFKILTKCCGFVINQDKKTNYKLLQSRKQFQKKLEKERNGEVDNNESLQTQINGIKESLQTQINGIKDAILKSNSFLEKIGDRPRKIQFKIIGENKHIELYVYGDDSVVFIKDLICSEWNKSKDFHYKIMKLKCDEKGLKNNDYLLSQIPSGKDTVKCEITNKLKAKDIVVLWIKGVHQRNVFLQVDKNDKINQLKDIIKKLINRSNFAIFHKKNEKFTKLEDGQTIENYQLKDKDFIQIVSEVQINLNIQSIFDYNHQTLPVECCNTDSILSIHNKIKDTLIPAALILIMDSQYLDKNNFIFQYNISSDSQIKYCRFNLAKNYIKISEKKFPKDNIALATNHIKKREIIVKTFVITVENNFKTNMAFIKELSTFDILRSKHEFVQIDEPFIDENLFYIPMEYMKEGSLKDYLEPRNKVGNYVNENEIINWSKQILDALDFLHHNNIIHRNLKTSNILLYDGKKKLKLSNFSLSKYLNDVDLKEAVDGFMQTGFQPSRHLAPEMTEEIYGNKIDIWSFGTVLLEMNNGKSIFPGLKDDTRALLELSNAATNEDIKYDLRENTSENFKKFISRCLEINPSLRSTAEELKEDPFLK